MAEHVADVTQYFRVLSERLARVRICCGDWSRILGPSVTTLHGLTGVFLDPPYSAEAGRDNNLYAEESGTVAHDVRAWALEHGDDPLFRIALCGYEGEHAMPDSWECLAWKARGGMGNQNKVANNNKHRERIWFSPHCLHMKGLFDV
jgi:site-specific DNA-adenine methylase